MELERIVYSVWITTLVILILAELFIGIWGKRKQVKKEQLNYLFSLLFSIVMFIGFIIMIVISGISFASIVSFLLFVMGIVMALMLRKKF